MSHFIPTPAQIEAALGPVRDDDDLSNEANGTIITPLSPADKDRLWAAYQEAQAAALAP